MCSIAELMTPGDVGLKPGGRGAGRIYPDRVGAAGVFGFHPVRDGSSYSTGLIFITPHSFTLQVFRDSIAKRARDGRSHLR
jgi:hypothetical protein